MGGFLENAINLIPPKQNDNAIGSRGTSEQPGTTKGYNNATTESLGGIPSLKSNGFISKAANASLHGGRAGGGTAAATFNTSGLNFSFQRRSDVIDNISSLPAAAAPRKTAATSAFPPAAGNATTQRPLQGMRSSASLPSLESQIESVLGGHPQSRRVSSLQARPQDYENSVPQLPDEGLPELSFDDSTVDPQFFAEEGTSLDRTITQKDTSLSPGKQLQHAQKPDAFSKRRSRELLNSDDKQRPLKKVNLGISSNVGQDSTLENAQRLKDSLPHPRRPSQPASRAFPFIITSRPISVGSSKNKVAITTSPKQSLARSTANKFIYVDDKSMRFPELSPPSLKSGYRPVEERQSSPEGSPPRKTVRRPQPDLGSDSSDADDEAVKIPSNYRSPATGRAVQESTSVRLQRPNALHDPFKSQSAELSEHAHGKDDEDPHSSPIVEWTEEEQRALEARASVKRQKHESERAREGVEMDYEELLPDEDIEENALEPRKDAQADQAHLNGELQLPTSEADPSQNEHSAQAGDGDLDQDGKDDKMIGEELVNQEHLFQEPLEKRPDCQCGNCMLPLKAQRDEYDLQTLDEWCDEGKVYIQQLPELLNKMLEVMKARVQAVNTLANKPKVHKDSIMAKQAENEAQRNKIKAWKNGLPFGAQFAAPPALSAADRGGSVSDTPPGSQACPAS